MSTLLWEEVESVLASTSDTEIKKLLDILKKDFSLELDDNLFQSKVLKSALADEKFAKHLFKQILDHHKNGVSEGTRIYIFQPGAFQQSTSLLSYIFYKKCKDFSQALKDMDLPEAPRIVWGNDYLALVTVGKKTDDIEVYLWDLAFC